MIDISERIRSNKHNDKIVTAEAAALLINPDDTVALSGFTPAGYPKLVTMALAKRMEKEPFKINLWSGGSVGPEVDTELSKVKGIKQRLAYQTNADLRVQLNDGTISYSDLHVSIFAQNIRYGFYGKIDVGIVEVVAITEDGDLVPSSGIGIMPTVCSQCDKIIVEVNTSEPLAFEGMHDIYEPKDPPNRDVIPILHVGDRIGTTTVKCGWDKIVAIVPSDKKRRGNTLKLVDSDTELMSQHIISFFENEVKLGRLPKNLLPLQSGVGSVSNAVISGLAKSNFLNLSIYTEVLQDGMLDLIDSGKVDSISSAAITTSNAGTERFNANIDKYRKFIVLRPQELSNNPEVSRRIGVIALNTAIEFDIYGNVNSTHFYGSKVMNGIGGSCDFSRSSFLSIFCTTSVAKGGAASSVVPFVSHIDQTEHDVDILVTEQGLADLRGLCPQDRARTIIEKCVHPDFKEQLMDYFERAIEKTNSAHIPILLDEVFSWHSRFLETGSMKIK